jgi:hypothetical protein
MTSKNRIMIYGPKDDGTYVTDSSPSTSRPYSIVPSWPQLSEFVASLEKPAPALAIQ